MVGNPWCIASAEGSPVDADPGHRHPPLALMVEAAYATFSTDSSGFGQIRNTLVLMASQLLGLF